MKSENDIIENILSFAERDENVIAVIRTDLLPVRDYLYTYNFYFVVNDVERFNSDSSFETCFGDRILLFRVDNNYPEMFSNTKAHLMVFRDSITIVINAIDKNSFLEKYNNENKYENVWIGDTFQKILYKKTYPNSDYESIWNAYAAVTDLWGKVGRDVAKRCGFHYPDKVEEDMLAFIEMLRKK